MDWSTFLFGVATGTLFTLASFAVITLRWLRPYLKAARRKSTMSVKEKNLAKALWERESQDFGWGGNDPRAEWFRRQKKHS